MRRGAPEVSLLQLAHVPPPPPSGAIIASGDGAGPSPLEQSAAGSGGVVYAPPTRTRPTPRVHLVAEPVICTPGAAGYRGAQRPTNNAGELQAIATMAEAAAAIAHPGEYVEIQTDSRLALLAALGVKPRGSKRKKKNKGGGAAASLDAPLVTRAREAIHAARAKLGHRVVVRKVKAHSGEPLNELADSLAASGRALAAGHEPVTAELIDRLQRAIDGLGCSTPPDITTQGLAL